MARTGWQAGFHVPSPVLTAAVTLRAGNPGGRNGDQPHADFLRKQPWAVSRTATSEASTAPRMSCAECNVTGGLVAVAMTQAHRKRF